jgi:hypothetical protein
MLAIVSLGHMLRVMRAGIDWSAAPTAIHNAARPRTHPP